MDDGEGNLLLFRKGARSGLTYVSVIPHKELNQSISRMNWMAVLLFALPCLLVFWHHGFSPENQPAAQENGYGSGPSGDGAISREYCRIQRHFQPSEGFADERKIIKEWMDHTKPR